MLSIVFFLFKTTPLLKITAPNAQTPNPEASFYLSGNKRIPLLYTWNNSLLEKNVLEQLDVMVFNNQEEKPQNQVLQRESAEGSVSY